MLSKGVVYDRLPFFWSRLFNKAVSYIGHTDSWDEVYIDGDLSKQTFVAYYIKQNRVVAAAAMNRGSDIHIIKEAIAAKVMATGEEVKSPDFKIESLKEKFKGKCSKCKKTGTCKSNVTNPTQ
jgi:apoptosis-inducing factor 3